jgi:hypothetical protein
MRKVHLAAKHPPFDILPNELVEAVSRLLLNKHPHSVLAFARANKRTHTATAKVQTHARAAINKVVRPHVQFQAKLNTNFARRGNKQELGIQLVYYNPRRMCIGVYYSDDVGIPEYIQALHTEINRAAERITESLGRTGVGATWTVTARPETLDLCFSFSQAVDYRQVLFRFVTILKGRFGHARMWSEYYGNVPSYLIDANKPLTSSVMSASRQIQHAFRSLRARK